MTELKQKQWPEFRNYTLEAGGLRLESKQDNQFINTLIDFEQIGSKEMIVNQKANPYGYIAFISVFINILFLIYVLADQLQDSGVLGGISAGFVAGLSFWAKFLFRFTKNKVIQGPVSVSFYYRPKEQEQVDNFIYELQQKKIAFLRQKYMSIDKYTPVEQLKNQFLWLRSSQYINDEEIEWLMEELENRRLMNGE
jgi:hypothetical protein